MTPLGIFENSRNQILNNCVTEAKEKVTMFSESPYNKKPFIFLLYKYS